MGFGGFFEKKKNLCVSVYIETPMKVFPAVCGRVHRQWFSLFALHSPASVCTSQYGVSLLMPGFLVWGAQGIKMLLCV